MEHARRLATFTALVVAGCGSGDATGGGPTPDGGGFDATTDVGADGLVAHDADAGSDVPHLSDGSTDSGSSADIGVPIPKGATWYAATTGSATNDGSKDHPWDLVTALNGPSVVKPGDTIWVRGGKYGGGEASSVIASHLVGTKDLPILVRAYPAERATIDAWLQVGCCDTAPDPSQGSYTWFWGLELAGYATDRTSGTSGPPEWAHQANHASADTWGAGTRFVDCIVHDTSGGLSVWLADDAVLYGNIVFDVGGYGTDRGHGHDFYLQNKGPATLKVIDNIGFDNFDMGLQAYGSSDAYVQNLELTGNVLFNSGILYYGKLVDNVTIGGGIDGPSGIVLDENVFYDSPDLDLGYNELGFLWTPRAHDAVVTNNHFLGGKQAVDFERWDSLVFQHNEVFAKTEDEAMLVYRDDQTLAGKYDLGDNHYFGSGQFTIYAGCDTWPCPGSPSVLDFAGWKSTTGLDGTSTFASGAPTGVWTSVRPNPYDLGRANVVVVNWDLRATVDVDVSAVGMKVGDAFVIRDAENWYGGAVVTGTYTGAPITLPMTGLTIVQPVGSVPYTPSHTAPQLGVFVLLSGEALKNTY